MNCRSCGSRTHPIFSLGEMPLANSLLNSPDESYKKYPLELALCETCSLVQLTETVPPEEMFTDYSYLTSYSSPMVAHAKSLVESVRKRIPLDNRSLVMEIGSNDGYLLQHYGPIPVLGIDPSERAADAAAKLDIPTVRGFFSAAMAKGLGPQADIIHANNVLAHVPDLNDFVLGLSLALKPDGTVIIEVPYLYELLAKTAFDQCYHEHVYQFSLTALDRLFTRHGMTIIRTEKIDTHGGSLRIWASKIGSRGHSTSLILSQESFFIHSPGYYSDFSSRVEKCKLATREMLADRVVAGFGAAAKATIFLNYCGITNAQMSIIADDTPTKQGKFIPGTGIQVVPVANWLAEQPDATMILAWNFSQAIAHKYRTAYKGRFFTWYSPELARSA